MAITQLLFIIFAAVAVLAALFVVWSANPVRSALCLVLCFFACAAVWLLAQAEFLALVLVLVYVGAVMTLFLFVIMMLNLDRANLAGPLKRYLPFAFVIVAGIAALALYALSPAQFNVQHLSQAVTHGLAVNNTAQLGSVLYTQYAYAFVIAGLLLLVAIISAISLSHRGPRDCKTQRPDEQIQVRRDDRVRIVKMSAEQKQ